MAHDKYFAICENKCLVDITHLEHATGKYIGNGSASQRDIAIGGSGNFVLITSARGMAIVSAYGAICKGRDDTTVTGLAMSDIYFIPRSNTLRITTKNSLVNETGDEYTFERI